jgi:hypothetical protein
MTLTVDSLNDIERVPTAPSDEHELNLIFSPPWLEESYVRAEIETRAYPLLRAGIVLNKKVQGDTKCRILLEAYHDGIYAVVQAYGFPPDSGGCYAQWWRCDEGDSNSERIAHYIANAVSQDTWALVLQAFRAVVNA